jgi:predicted transcriptional regulator
MHETRHKNLSRREREIMDVVYRLGEAGVSEVRARMSNNPTYDTIRVLLGILTKKGHLVRHRDGRRYVYRASVSRETAGRAAIRNLLTTFFSGAPSKAVLTMLDESAKRLTQEELEEIKARIEKETRS